MSWLAHGKHKMKDVQSEPGNVEIDINKVGINNLSIPLIIADKEHSEQSTIAKINMYVNLPKQYKGIHMSRFLEIIYAYTARAISIKDVEKILSDMQEKFDAEEAHLDLKFPFFLRKKAPITKKTSLLDYKCKFLCSKGKEKKSLIVIEVPITTLCPCSKEISKYGAHNQRSIVTVKVLLNEFVWIEDLIKLVEDEASCQIYPLLKRPDEKYVTEKAYENPNFVEDVVRKVAMKLRQMKELKGFTVECENYESIHNHNAYAYIEEGLK